ncbi:MAG: InlB B-repeat-containing protein, partial [Oscillospiraceae bacterium]|nr:InlB B-repeat-containing protein [Oscillospiraceae bacterium]
MKMKRLIAFTLLVCIFLMMPVSQVFAMQVNIEVEYDGNGILALDVEETDTIESVKSMILDNTGVSIDEQILVFNDQVLENSKTLQDYSITDGTLIKLAGPYSVTFIGNGYAQDTTITVKYGSMVELPSPEWDGVTFEGWYTDEECKKAFDPQTAIKTDTILYSKWKEIYCTVSFDNNGIGSETKPVQVRYGMQLEEYPEPPVAEGYVFDRWCADKDGSWFNPNSYITEDITLYAQWAVNAENTITIDNITFHFDNYPVPDQPLTTAGIYFDAGENTSLLSLDVPSWTEWDYYAFDENRLPVNECKMSEDSDSVTHFRAGKYYMYWCRISTPYSMGTMSIAVPPVVCSLDTTLNINCPNLMDYQCWPWARWTDPETGEMSALVLEVAIVFKAPEYEVIEDEITDTTFEQGTDDVVVLHFNGDISLFDELIIDGNVVPK